MLTHRLTGVDFDALAAGIGSPSAIAALRSAQLSRRLIALRAILDSAEAIGCKAMLPGFVLLTDVQHSDAAAVRDVLEYPFTGSWMAQSLRLLEDADGTSADLATHLGYLSNIAAAAAIRANMQFSIDILVRDGAVYLPTLGRALVGGVNTATVRSDGRNVTAGGVPTTGGPRWQPVRRLTASVDDQHLTVTLDDTDPYRGRALPVTARLSDEAIREWQSSLIAAWDILARYHRDYAEAIGAGLTALVPLTAKRQNRGITATSRESFGAAAICMPPDPLTLAVALLHEFQHGKLNAVLDLVALYRSGEQRRFYAPWRQDPRPLGGLLHGAYAHLGVSDFWRVQSTLPDTPFPAFAQLENARWSASAREVIDVLLDSRSLTAAGERFVGGMRDHLPERADGISPDTARLAWIARSDHRVGWRLRNLRPDPDAIDSLVRDWLAGLAGPAGGAVPITLVDGGSSLGVNDRLDLLYSRLRDGRQLPIAEHRMDPADVDLIYGNTAAAITAYRARIASEPHSREAWAGLTLALRESGRCPDALLHGPEIVYAVNSKLRGSVSKEPDPELLARWLAPATSAGGVAVNDLAGLSRIQ